jgi:hypothetical protein
LIRYELIVDPLYLLNVPKNLPINNSNNYFCKYNSVGRYIYIYIYISYYTYRYWSSNIKFPIYLSYGVNFWPLEHKKKIKKFQWLIEIDLLNYHSKNYFILFTFYFSKQNHLLNYHDKIYLTFLFQSIIKSRHLFFTIHWFKIRFKGFFFLQNKIQTL